MLRLKDGGWVWEDSNPDLPSRVVLLTKVIEISGDPQDPKIVARNEYGISDTLDLEIIPQSGSGLPRIKKSISTDKEYLVSELIVPEIEVQFIGQGNKVLDHLRGKSENVLKFCLAFPVGWKTNLSKLEELNKIGDKDSMFGNSWNIMTERKSRREISIYEGFMLSLMDNRIPRRMTEHSRLQVTVKARFAKFKEFGRDSGTLGWRDMLFPLKWEFNNGSWILRCMMNCKLVGKEFTLLVDISDPVDFMFMMKSLTLDHSFGKKGGAVLLTKFKIKNPFREKARVRLILHLDDTLDIDTVNRDIIRKRELLEEGDYMLRYRYSGEGSFRFRKSRKIMDSGEWGDCIVKEELKRFEFVEKRKKWDMTELELSFDRYDNEKLLKEEKKKILPIGPELRREWFGSILCEFFSAVDYGDGQCEFEKKNIIDEVCEFLRGISFDGVVSLRVSLPVEGAGGIGGLVSPWTWVLDGDGKQIIVENEWERVRWKICAFETRNDCIIPISEGYRGRTKNLVPIPLCLLEDAEFSTSGMLVNNMDIRVELQGEDPARSKYIHGTTTKTGPTRRPMASRHSRRRKRQGRMNIGNPFGEAALNESRSEDFSKILREQSAGRVSTMNVFGRSRVRFEIDLDGSEATEPEDFIDDQIKALGLDGLSFFGVA